MSGSVAKMNGLMDFAFITIAGGVVLHYQLRIQYPTKNHEVKIQIQRKPILPKKSKVITNPDNPRGFVIL